MRPLSLVLAAAGLGLLGLLSLHLSVLSASNHAVLNFRAHLSGGEEVPSADTRAQGQAIFQLSSDGTELYYKLIVANIENVTQAHIHLAPRGVNGPVVAWLYPSGPPSQLIPGRFNGVLAEGVITDANLFGPLSTASLATLVEHILIGNTYVNVHTAQFPAGEVRGQID
jgi:hypothetical protein